MINLRIKANGYKFVLALTTLFTFANVSASANSISIKNIEDRDLAIIIPKDNAHAFSAFKTSEGFGVLPSSAYDSILNSFIDTEVKDALSVENRIDEWSVVSARMEPCAPLFPHIRTKDTLCWPEVRLVFQPILKKKINYQGTLQSFFADDRNVHALFHISPYAFLKTSDAKIAEELISKIKETNSLTEEEFKVFTKLRNESSTGFLEEVMSLRASNIASVDYKGFDMRPEFYNEYSASLFTTKFQNFLKRHAFFQRLHTATAFSLPEGRTPTHLDRWVFKKYALSANGTLSEVDLTIHHKNGRVMFNIGKTETSSMQKDDDKFYSDDLSDRQKMMLSHHVVLNRSSDAKLLDRIADENSFLVDHTSCASCHKLNEDEPANFHALSYFINEPQPTVSRRVKMDVEIDKSWIESNL
jgi:uncharacterized protein YnzC (UPF0291/DUF896 family)